jgi:hypothetical protein
MVRQLSAELAHEESPPDAYGKVKNRDEPLYGYMYQRPATLMRRPENFFLALKHLQLTLVNIIRTAIMLMMPGH